MCIGYMDLNKACLKDSYPLPNIYRLVDGASSFGLLSFMDVYLGYNQIRIQDEAKMTFITDSGAFCYKKFMLIIWPLSRQRSTTVNNHYKALARVFTVLKKHELKLNPEKCSFGV
ncbi:hypothetical protein CR513_62538, partial [Mucuna pruriens]